MGLLIYFEGMRLEVLTVVLMTVQVHWVVTPCQVVNSYWCFKGFSAFKTSVSDLYFFTVHVNDIHI